PAAWSLGAILGPGVGGMLVNPAKHYPGTFSPHGIFGRYWLWFLDAIVSCRRLTLVSDRGG
ncbi:unnamed protein product, partial [Laminaria digitata]